MGKLERLEKFPNVTFFTSCSAIFHSNETHRCEHQRKVIRDPSVLETGKHQQTFVFSYYYLPRVLNDMSHNCSNTCLQRYI
jgi:hypothetical protein